MKVTRRTALVISAAASMALKAGPVFAADKLRLGKAIGSSFPFAGADLGKAKGIFAADGIEAEISVFRGDGQLQQALAAGDDRRRLRLGPGHGLCGQGRSRPSRSPPCRASRATCRSSSPRTARSRRVDDLKGKRIGVTTAGSLTDWLTRRLSESKGWGPNGIEVTPMGEMRTRLAAMKSGELAGSVNSIQESPEPGRRTARAACWPRSATWCRISTPM